MNYVYFMRKFKNSIINFSKKNLFLFIGLINWLIILCVDKSGKDVFFIYWMKLF